MIHRHERVIWEVSLSGKNGAQQFFETTDDHPWWIIGEDGEGRWVTTDGLRAGMQAVSRVGDTGADDALMTIASAVETARIDATYNLTVAEFHTYFVGKQKILVHNCGDEGSDGYSGHGENPEGQTGSGSGNWNKHSDRRAGKRYGQKRNSKRGNKNKKYIKPPNPNKKK